MATKKKENYFEAVGRRKTASARVRIYPSSKQAITVNDKEADEYFSTDTHHEKVREALMTPETSQKFEVSVKVTGGGATAQAEAIRLGIARALVAYDAEHRSPLKKAGFLKRDPRRKERKKFGLKKARKRPQWSKR